MSTSILDLEVIPEHLIVIGDSYLGHRTFFRIVL